MLSTLQKIASNMRLLLLLFVLVAVNAKLEFGKKMKKKFLIDPNIVFLNHGSRGAVPRVVFHQQMLLKRKMESNPSDWFRGPSKKMYDKAVTSAAKFVNSNEQNLVLVDNLSTGLETVLDSISFDEGDGILIADSTYSGVRKKVQQMADDLGTSTIKIRTRVPLYTEQMIIDIYTEALENNPNIKIAIIDHVTILGLVQPIEKLTLLCQKHGVTVIIDGAHAPGQVEVNMNNTKVDYYIGNFYKWAYSSHACAFLWISPRHMDSIRPLVVSAFYPKSLQHQFHFYGTRDTTNFYTLPTALEFFEKIGGRDKITSYSQNLLIQFKKNITRVLGTEVFPMPDGMRAPGMMMVEMPFNYDGDSDDITYFFSEEYKTEVVFFNGENKILLRVLANVHNTPEDFMKLQTTLVEYIDEVKAGKTRTYLV